MHIFLWILQVFLALHTAMGAIWKFSHSAEQTMPSLSVISNSVWLVMAIVELLCSLALVLPVLHKSLPVVGALVIAAEMLIFCGLHFYSSPASYSPMIYWLVVAGVCGFIAYGRLLLNPF